MPTLDSVAVKTNNMFSNIINHASLSGSQIDDSGSVRCQENAICQNIVPKIRCGGGGIIVLDFSGFDSGHFRVILMLQHTKTF